jgi:formylglycine-generating enzyme required for sulfatase activity
MRHRAGSRRAALVGLILACVGLVVGSAMRRAAAQRRVPQGSGDLRSIAPPPAASVTHGAPTFGEDEPPPEDEPPSGSVPTPAPPAPLPSAPPPTKGRSGILLKDGMLRLPGGRFFMGSTDPKAPPNERHPHFETVAPFWIDRTEVTVDAYRQCVEKNLCRAPARSSPSCTFDMGDPLLPVSCVHFEDADGYCRSLAKRLPREVEWEFAARGTTKALYPWGGRVSTCAMAATLLNDTTGRSCSGKRPSRVGTHPLGASPFGVMDMAGNVEEWTSDWYSEEVAGGAAPTSGASRTLRGGGWLSGPSMSRTTSRDWGSVLEAGANVGFRCARGVRPDEPTL